MLSACHETVRVENAASPQAGTTIDVVSCDIEKSEATVFRNFPFEKYNIRFFVLEVAESFCTWKPFLLRFSACWDLHASPSTLQLSTDVYHAL